MQKVFKSSPVWWPVIISTKSLEIILDNSPIAVPISIRVDNEIKADIYEKMLSTDWEAITHYHTGDLKVRGKAS